MLVHALILSTLLSVSVATVTYLLTGSIESACKLVALTWSGISLLCFRAQWLIAEAHMNGRIERAQYVRPTPIERVYQIPAPVPTPASTSSPERVRFIPVRSHASYAHNPLPRMAKMNAESPVSPPRLETRHGVNEADLRWFVSGLSTKGSHSRRKWEGRVAPSGAVVDAEYHALLIAPLVTCGAITGRGERRAGSLVMSPQEILEHLKLME